MSREKLDYSIKEVYGSELLEIKTKLEQIESGRVLELSHSNGDGYLATNVNQLRKMFSSLLSKIQNGKDSIDEELADIFISKNL